MISDTFKVLSNNASESLSDGNNINEATINDNFALSLIEVPDSLLDENEIYWKRVAEASSAWISMMGDTVLSVLRRVFNDDETFIAVNTIIKKEVDMIGENSNLFGDVDIGFFIKHKDDNYITTMFNGFIFCEGCAYPALMLRPIMIDIKNKRRVILSDIININDLFVETVFKQLEKVFREELDKDVNSFYTIEELKDALREADIPFENRYPPDIRSCFDANDLIIYFSVANVLGRFKIVRLPLNEIRSMIILPNLPIDSQQHK
jgi:hypothetical protein